MKSKRESGAQNFSSASKKANQALQCIGEVEQTEFYVLEVYQKNEWMGGLFAAVFWKGLHIRQLFLDPKLRGKGIGKERMMRAFSFAKEKGCHFACLETTNYQAYDFYKHFGFFKEFTRKGYTKGVELHMMRKDFE